MSIKRKTDKVLYAYRNRESLVSFIIIMSDLVFRFIMKFWYSIKYRENMRRQSPIYLSPISTNSTDLVTIIIPFRDKVSVLKKCVSSIFEKTIYKNYTLLLVDNQSIESETIDYISFIKSNLKIKVVKYDAPFNYSALHNWAMRFVSSEYVLLLNNDTEVIALGWLSSMVAWIEKDDVGVVGALLLYPNGKVQHAGVAVYPMKLFHFYEGEELDGKFKTEIHGIRELYAVTGACLLTKRSFYNKVGGLDAENFSIGLNDIDYCLKLHRGGYKIIYDSKAMLYHHESLSRGFDYADPNKFFRLKKEKRYFWWKWNKYISNIL